MNLVPDNVNFLASAASSTAKARMATPSHPTGDSSDVAVALKCIGSYQIQGSPEELRLLDDESNAAPLIAAARTLQSTAEYLLSLGSLDADNHNELMLFAAVAHAMYGNFPSAKAALYMVKRNYVLATPMRCIAATVCDPTGPLATQTDDPISGMEGFRWHWWHVLRGQTKEQREASLQESERILAEVALTRSGSGDRALALSLELAMKQADRLSTASLFELAPEIPRWFVERTINSGVVTLLPPQHDLLAHRRIATSNRNGLLTLPTSTGKTLIAEACMASASMSGGLSVYVAPYVAIGEQVRASLNNKLDGQIQLVSMFGGFRFESVRGTGGRALIVVTPERFDAWLRAGEYLENLRLVVFDEVHIVENGSRGARVEGLISRLRLLQRRLPQLRILGLSAVLADPDRVCDWMGVTPDNLHRMSWRPTARRVAVCRANGRMHWVHGNDALRPSGMPPNEPISTPINIGIPERVVPAMNPVTYEVKASSNVAAITLDLLHRIGWPALVVCRRRADTRMLARALANQRQPIDDIELLALADSIVARYDWLAPLATYVRSGIAYHNASLPFDIRRDIEQATRGRKLFVVCSTTTLAEGADLPFRWTLVSHWLGSDGQALKPMTFRNIAGRSGRAGAFTEGDTILFENRGGPPGAFQIASMENQLNAVMFGSAPIESTAGDNFPSLPDEQRAAIQSVFSSQLLAAIQENPGENDIVGLLSSATYAVRDHDQGSVREVLGESLEALLDSAPAGGALAVINSPIRLTAVGQAANSSGFSPGSARKMLEYLASTSPLPTGIPLLDQLLFVFGNMDEQQNYLWKKIINNPGQRHPLKQEDMQVVLEKLARRMNMHTIFEELPARVRARARPKQPSEDSVDKQFDQFVTLLDSLVYGYLPWLIRGLSIFAPFGSEAGQAVNWDSFAIEVEGMFGSEAQEDEPLDD